MLALKLDGTVHDVPDVKRYATVPGPIKSAPVTLLTFVEFVPRYQTYGVVPVDVGNGAKAIS